MAGTGGKIKNTRWIVTVLPLDGGQNSSNRVRFCGSPSPTNILLVGLGRLGMPARRFKSWWLRMDERTLDKCVYT